VLQHRHHHQRQQHQRMQPSVLVLPQYPGVQCLTCHTLQKLLYSGNTVWLSSSSSCRRQHPQLIWLLILKSWQLLLLLLQQPRQRPLLMLMPQEQQQTQLSAHQSKQQQRQGQPQPQAPVLLTQLPPTRMLCLAQ
jgi:hypothetical protein